MKYLNVLPKEQQNLKCACEKSVLQQSWRPTALLKRTPTQVITCEYSKSFRDSFF